MTTERHFKPPKKIAFALDWLAFCRNATITAMFDCLTMTAGREDTSRPRVCFIMAAFWSSFRCRRLFQKWRACCKGAMGLLDRGLVGKARTYSPHMVAYRPYTIRPQPSRNKANLPPAFPCTGRAHHMMSKGLVVVAVLRFMMRLGNVTAPLHKSRLALWANIMPSPSKKAGRCVRGGRQGLLHVILNFP